MVRVSALRGKAGGLAILSLLILIFGYFLFRGVKLA